MNDIKEMVRADLTAPLNATMKRRRPKPKGMLQRAAIAAAHVDVDEVDVASEIRDARLYRQTHSTFEDYCKERWGMHRSRAYRLIEAAETVEALSPMGDTVPNNERQVRPLTKLEPEAQRQAWARAVVEVASTTVDIRAHVVENVSAVADIPAPQSERQARLPVHRSIQHGEQNRTNWSGPQCGVTDSRERFPNWGQIAGHRIPGAPAHQAGAGTAAAGVQPTQQEQLR